MPNASKRSGAKDTDLFSSRFHRTRVRLTLVYVAILAVILISSGAITRAVFSSSLDHRFRVSRNAPLTQDDSQSRLPPNPDDVRADLFNTTLLVDGGLLLLAGLLSYGFAGLTLRPIQDAYARQRRFLGDASHELRTPLAILRTDFENELTDRPTAIAKKQIESHLEEVARMTRLVDDLLAVARLDETGTMTAARDAVELANVVTAAVERLHGTAKKHEVAIKWDWPASGVTVHGNAELLLQAVTNVLKNAVTYNRPGGTVAVSIGQEDGRGFVRVTDTGIGIPDAHLKNIFERFYRVDPSRSRQTGGNGLGLSIVQAIMHQHGGSVRVKSEQGKGTVVDLLFPIRKAS